MGLLQLYCVRTVSEPAFLSLSGSTQIGVHWSALGESILQPLHLSFPAQKITQTEPFIMVLTKHNDPLLHCFNCTPYIFQELSVLWLIT